MDFKTVKKQHRYYLRSGFYMFLLSNIFKVASILLTLIVLFVVLEKWVIDLDVIFNSFFKRMANGWVFFIFSLSESFFGLIPPDFFIIWARKFAQPWLVVSLLAVISYLGGLVSYYIGWRVRSIKRLNKFLNDKFGEHFLKIRRWGSVFILVAALFPLPYSLVCMISGTLKFPFKVFVFLGLVRLLRFYFYGLVLFGLIN